MLFLFFVLFVFFFLLKPEEIPVLIQTCSGPLKPGSPPCNSSDLPGHSNCRFSYYMFWDHTMVHSATGEKVKQIYIFLHHAVGFSLFLIFFRNKEILMP